jgi:regulatory protein
MIVTKVEPLSKTKYKIYLNHQFAFVLYKGELRSYKISDGRELSEEELDEIREKIMHLLEDMDRSEAGLREKLKAGLYPEDLIEAAVTYVKSFGYLNDVRYAENFILARKSTKSKREILALLNRKGICSADIEKAFESCYGESEEVEAVRRILAKKKVDVRTADEREMQKIYGYLGRKGFRYDVVRQVIQNSIENA